MVFSTIKLVLMPSPKLDDGSIDWHLGEKGGNDLDHFDLSATA